MQILDQLWYGNLNSSEQAFSKGGLFDTTLKEMVKAEDKLRSLLTPEGLRLWEECQDKHATLSDLRESHAFTEGFRIGAQMILDVLREGESL